MSIKKTVLTAGVTVAALGMSAAAFASTSAAATSGSFGPFFGGSNSGFVVGVQGGYADQHWDNFFAPTGAGASNVKDTGFAARGFVGYDVNKYFGIEAGYTYLPKTTLNGIDSSAFDIKSYAVDVLAKLSVPVTNVFSVYAKAGGAYLNTKTELLGHSATNTHIGPAFGVGASYEVVPNLAIDVSWMRFSGQGHILDGYQASPDMVLLGVSYKFPARFS
jgi:opacity protein-like surface antigen